MIDYYDRDGRPLDGEAWARTVGDRAYKRVAETTVNGYWISTVWLGLNHAYGAGPPLIFETMVFERDETRLALRALADEHASDTRDEDRYATADEAIAGHLAMVAKWRAKD